MPDAVTGAMLALERIIFDFYLLFS